MAAVPSRPALPFPATRRLDAVAQAILNAAFDRDHLYAFQFDDVYDRAQTVPAPKNVSGPPYTDETRLGDLPLEEGGIVHVSVRL